MAAAPAAAKIAAGWAEITIARAAGMVAGQAKITYSMLVIVEEQRVAMILMIGVRLLGEKTVALLVRIDAHAHPIVEVEYCLSLFLN